MINKIKIHTFRFSVGDIVLGDYESRLCMCDWLLSPKHHQIEKRLFKYTNADFVEESTALMLEASAQLNEYLVSGRKDFNIPIVLYGTPFQLKVWNLLRMIPYGDTISYGMLAEKIGDRKKVRAVAGAVGGNPLSVFIPCHRVIGSDGSLTGYAGTLPVKQRLLSLETGNVSAAVKGAIVK